MSERDYLNVFKELLSVNIFHHELSWEPHDLAIDLMSKMESGEVSKQTVENVLEFVGEKFVYCSDAWQAQKGNSTLEQNLQVLLLTVMELKLGLMSKPRLAA